MTSAIPFSMDGCPSRLLLLLKGECMNQKAKPHKPSSVVGVQNGITFLGLCRFVSEEFDVKAKQKKCSKCWAELEYDIDSWKINSNFK